MLTLPRHPWQSSFLCGLLGEMLTTSGSTMNMSFNVSLCHPGSPFSSSSAPSYHQRQRGPAQKGRDRQRAARHQATLTAQLPPATNVPVITADVTTIAPVEPPVSVTTPEVAATPPLVTANSSASIFKTFTNQSSVFSVSENKCDYCGLVFITSEYLKNHVDKVHRPLQCPEKATYYYPKDL